MVCSTRQELKLYINSLEKKPHIIAINEVKPKHLTHNLLTSEFNLEGYHIFSHGLENDSERGLLIYTDITMDASLVDIPSAFCDSIFLSVKIADLGSRILIGNIYRSPNSTQVNDKNLY